MTLTTTPTASVPARGARKSPLRTATMTALADAVAEPAPADILLAPGRGPGEPVTAPELRRMQISEFAVWLRSRTNRNKRPFQEATVAAYTDAARSLDRWMTDPARWCADGSGGGCPRWLNRQPVTIWLQAGREWR